MQYLLKVFLLGLILPPLLFAHGHEHGKLGEDKHFGMQVVIENASRKIIANRAMTVRFQVMKNHIPLNIKELNTHHTKKIHVMIIDQTLTDYHHIHPRMDNHFNSFAFDFKPKKSGAYRVWVDITPRGTHEQVFLKTNIGSASAAIPVDKKMRLHASLNSYQFVLKLHGKPQSGKPIMASIIVTKDGKPFRKLEPVMGAFAHLVGFNAEYNSMIHIHPMGKEPHTESERGGSELMFHLNLQNPGFAKLFAQFRINGQDFYVPFGIVVGTHRAGFDSHAQ